MRLEEIRPQSVGEMRRVGSKNDGGYVIPVKLPRTKSLISFGLGDNWTFEKQLLKEGTLKNVTIYDHTVSVENLLYRIKSRLTTKNFSAMALAYRAMVLCAYFLDFKVKRYKHIRNEITESGAGFSQTNLILAAKEIGEPEFILKVDIEGGEYLIIDQICFLSTRIPLLIIEFHDTGSRRTEFEDAIAKLSKEYLICHSHANNFEPIGPDGIPTAIELTLGRRNFFHIHQEINSLPIPKLDAPSARNRKDHTIAFEKL